MAGAGDYDVEGFPSGDQWTRADCVKAVEMMGGGKVPVPKMNMDGMTVFRNLTAPHLLRGGEIDGIEALLAARAEYQNYGDELAGFTGFCDAQVAQGNNWKEEFGYLLEQLLDVNSRVEQLTQQALQDESLEEETKAEFEEWMSEFRQSIVAAGERVLADEVFEGRLLIQVLAALSDAIRITSNSAAPLTESDQETLLELLDEFEPEGDRVRTQEILVQRMRMLLEEQDDPQFPDLTKPGAETYQNAVGALVDGATLPGLSNAEEREQLSFLTNRQYLKVFEMPRGKPLTWEFWSKANDFKQAMADLYEVYLLAAERDARLLGEEKHQEFLRVAAFRTALTGRFYAFNWEAGNTIAEQQPLERQKVMVAALRQEVMALVDVARQVFARKRFGTEGIAPLLQEMHDALKVFMDSGGVFSPADAYAIGSLATEEVEQFGRDEQVWLKKIESLIDAYMEDL
tara:strand:- start:8946 stop:10319 length:1374 start_codon:yes stop_codon:yes gene_type:complete